MSRVGKLPVAIPSGVTVEVRNTVVHVKGPKCELSHPVLPSTEVKIERGEARVPHYGVPLLESDNIQIRRTKHRNEIRCGMQRGRFLPKTSIVNEHVALFPDWSTAVYVIR